MPDTPGAALIVVDMQNAFVDPSAGPAVEDARRVVTAVNARIADAAGNGWPIFYTRDIAPTELPPGDPDGETDLHHDVHIAGTVVDKGPGKDGGMSGFVLHRDGPGAGGLSDLAHLLRDTGCARVVIVGLAADVCVAATAQDARRLGYDVTVDLPATAFVHASPDGDQDAINQLQQAGIRITNPDQSARTLR